MNRNAALALLGAAVLGVGVFWAHPWASELEPLPCDKAQLRIDASGVARCGDGAPLSAAQRLTLGLKIDVNSASVEDLVAVPGIGPSLAREIVGTRNVRGPFASWNEFEQVRGIGPSRSEQLKESLEIK